MSVIYTYTPELVKTENRAELLSIGFLAQKVCLLVFEEIGGLTYKIGFSPFGFGYVFGVVGLLAITRLPETVGVRIKC